MYTFLILSIPLVLLIFCTSNSSYGWKSFVPPLAIGGVTGIVVSFVKKFLIFSRYTWTASAVSACMHLFLTQALLPFVLCYAVFLIFSRDSLAYKLESSGALMGSFFAVYIPFVVISGSDKAAFFLNFGKPLLYAGLCVWFAEWCALGASNLKNKKIVPAVCFFVIAALNLVVPAFAESHWYFSDSSAWTVFAVIYVALSICFYVFLNRGQPDYVIEEQL